MQKLIHKLTFLLTLLLLATPVMAADKTLPELGAATDVSDTDIFLCRESGDSVDNKCTGSQVKTYIQAAVGCGLTATNGSLDATQCPDRSVSGTTDTILTTDGGKIIKYSNGAAVAVTLPNAATSGFGAGFGFTVNATGAGAVTVTPTTSTINGGATLIIPAGQGCYIRSNGTNYLVDLASCPAITANGSIADNSVTNAKLAQMPTLTIKGNDTGGTANADDLTAAETKVLLGLKQEYCFALSDQTTPLTTGTAKATAYLAAAATVDYVRAYVNTAATGANLVIDINEAGSTALTTKLSIDATEKTSGTAATAAVIGGAGPAIAANAELTFDIDQIGSTIAGAGLVVCMGVTY